MLVVRQSRANWTREGRICGRDGVFSDWISALMITLLLCQTDTCPKYFVHARMSKWCLGVRTYWIKKARIVTTSQRACLQRSPLCLMCGRIMCVACVPCMNTWLAQPALWMHSLVLIPCFPTLHTWIHDTHTHKFVLVPWFSDMHTWIHSRRSQLVHSCTHQHTTNTHFCFHSWLFIHAYSNTWQSILTFTHAYTQDKQPACSACRHVSRVRTSCVLNACVHEYMAGASQLSFMHTWTYCAQIHLFSFLVLHTCTRDRRRARNIIVWRLLRFTRASFACDFHTCTHEYTMREHSWPAAFAVLHACILCVWFSHMNTWILSEHSQFVHAVFQSEAMQLCRACMHDVCCIHACMNRQRAHFVFAYIHTWIFVFIPWFSSMHTWLHDAHVMSDLHTGTHE